MKDLHLEYCQITMLMMMITTERTTARIHIFLRDFCYSDGKKILSLSLNRMYATCIVLDPAMLLHILLYINKQSIISESICPKSKL